MRKNKIRKIIAHLLAVAVLLGTATAVCAPLEANAVGTAGIEPGDFFLMGKTDAAGYTGLPLWRVIDKDAEGNLFLMSEYLWTAEDADTFIQFGTISESAVPMEGYEDQGYVSKGSAWQGSIAQAWCRGFETEVLGGIDGLTIMETTKTDDEFTSPDPTESTEDAYIKYAWTRDILKNDKVFFLSAEEAAHYMPDTERRAAYLHDGVNIGECKDWWLRSPRLFTISACAGKVFAYGSRRGMIGRQSVGSLGAARPAFRVLASSDLSQYKCSIKYTWSADRSSCTAAVCFEGRQLMTETASSKSKVTKQPTVSETGVTTYTAVFAHPSFSAQIVTTSIAKKPASEPAAKPASRVDLPAVKIVKPKAGKKSLTVKWKKVSAANRKKISRIQIQYSTDRKFKKGVKTVYAKKTAVSRKISRLKSKKKYYVRVRSYRKTGGTTYASKWSAVRSVRVK